MNKYDSFSIPHLQLYLDALAKKTPERNFAKIVWWDELKEILELCKLKNLEKKC